MSYLGVGAVGHNVVDLDSFSGNGSTTAFTLTRTPTSQESLLVVTDGVVQDPGEWALSGTTLTFTAAPHSGADIRIWNLSAQTDAAEPNSTIETLSGVDGSQLGFTLSNSVASQDQVLVFVDGIMQNDSKYSVSGTTLTFGSGNAPPNGSVLDVCTLTSGGFSTTIPADGTVTLAKLSASGTASSSTFLRGDNSWSAPSGGVDTTGTPADNQVAIWTDSDTLEGETGLTFDGSTLVTDGDMKVPDDKGYILGSGGDIVITTNSGEDRLIVNAGTARDLTTYGHIYMFPGGSGGVNSNSSFYAGEGGYAALGINADQNDDAGDGWSFFAWTDNDLKIYNNNNEPAAILQWEGLLQLDSTVSENAFDYAEFFEWKTPLADDDEVEATLGMTVVLDGDKVRLAEAGEEDDILGVIRPNGVAHVNNEKIKWQGKYLRDVWSRFIFEPFTRTTWNEPDKSHRHSYPSDQIPAYRLKRDFSQDQPNWWLNEENFEKDKDGEFIPVVVPETDEEKEATDFLVRDYHRGSGKPLERRIFNPDFQQDQEYEQRQDRRKEWAIVGLIGQVIIRQDAIIPDHYRFMKWAQEATGEGTDDWVPGLGDYFIK